MDEESLRLSGITTDPKTTTNASGKTPATQTTRQIIKPAWLTNTDQGAEQVTNCNKNPGAPVSSSTPIGEKIPNKPATKRVRKRRISSASTPRNLRPRTSRTSEHINLTETESGTASTEEEVEMTDISKKQDGVSDLKTYLKEQLDQLKTEMKRDVNGAVDRISAQVQTNTQNIAKIQCGVDAKIESAVSASVSREIKKYLPQGNGTLAPRTCPDPGREAEYWKARRSIRCWPVNATPNDLWGKTGDFFTLTLGIPVSCLPQSSVESIRRISSKRSTRPARIQNEVLVTFKDVAVRDMVMSYAPNLARF